MNLLNLIEPVEPIKFKPKTGPTDEELLKVLVFYKNGIEVAHQSIGLRSQLKLADDKQYSKVDIYEWTDYWQAYKKGEFQLGK